MNELIKKCQELYQALEKKMLEVANQDLASKQTVEDLKKEAARLQGIGRDLKSREAAVAQIENVSAALEETRKLKQDTSAQVEELTRDRNAFIALRDRTMREIAEQQEQIAAAKARNDEASAKIEADKAKLAEDRKNMKAQLLADMAKA
jgi:chromosome segregation ATPase